MEFFGWQSMGSLMATVMFLRMVLRDYLPPGVYKHLHRILHRIVAYFDPCVRLLVEEYDSYAAVNELYESVQSYLSSKCLASDADVLLLSKHKNSPFLTFSMAENATQSLHDRSIPDLPVVWSFHAKNIERNRWGSQVMRYYELSFHRKYKERVHKEYIPHVMDESASFMFKRRERRLYTNRSCDGSGRLWSHVPFLHPSNFQTLAIDPVVKEDIKADLAKFISRQEYFSRVGRSWKRGYLLYGPPGTGKTSLVAAIANFLEFDIYDLELTAVTSNSELRKLLVSTTSKSVIVVEDIDCTLDLSRSRNPTITATGADENDNGSRKEKKRKQSSAVSLSGVLNFVDGLWSSCVGERLMIFTTNHVDKVDPALIRAGRMDKHIHLSYCLMPAFKVLVRNYLYVEERDEKYKEAMREVEGLLPGAKMSPADVAEVFMSCNDDAAAGLRMVVEKLRERVANRPNEAKDEGELLPVEDTSVDDDDDDDDNEDNQSYGNEVDDVDNSDESGDQYQK